MLLRILRATVDGVKIIKHNILEEFITNCLVKIFSLLGLAGFNYGMTTTSLT